MITRASPHSAASRRAWGADGLARSYASKNVSNKLRKDLRPSHLDGSVHA